MRLYTIYDRAAEESGPVFQAKNDAVARRGYMQAIDNSSSPYDFDLYYIGDYNQYTMQIDTLSNPSKVETENVIKEIIHE